VITPRNATGSTQCRNPPALTSVRSRIWDSRSVLKRTRMKPARLCRRSHGSAFLPGAVLPLSFTANWDRFQDYFTSLYQNSLPELAVFTAAFAALFFGLHLFFNADSNTGASASRWWWAVGERVGSPAPNASRRRCFNAVGLGVVSKTTGCEAMFLQAYPFGQMKEMFLFRPYDKATIWEQINVVRLAGRLNTDVMLWECMGLTPAYVRILQRSWMRDQFSTITNTYPDHEDLQGPAGINIPR